MQHAVWWETEIPIKIEDPKFKFNFGNSGGIKSYDFVSHLKRVSSKCGRFVDFPLVIPSKEWWKNEV